MIIANFYARLLKAACLAETILFLVSVLPLFLLVKSLLFKRSIGAKAAVSSFSRQVGYLATGIAAVLGAATLYHFANVWLRW